MRTLYMETTRKSPAETSAEIESVLSKYNLVEFRKTYDEDGDISGCYFALNIHAKTVAIRLPIRWQPLWQMAQRGETRYIKDIDQAQRTAWRQVFRWIEAQLSLVELEMVEIAEVFLPYMLVRKDRTLYQHMLANDMRLIEAPE